MEQILPYIEVLLPSVGIFFIFLFVYRAITRADKGERDAYQEALQEYREKNGINAEDET
jgi:hypothetical protein